MVKQTNKKTTHTHTHTFLLSFNVLGCVCTFFLFRSVSLQIHLEPMYIGDEGQQLPCKFYDVPGIEQNKKKLNDEELQKFLQQNIDELQEIIDGKMILDVDVSALNITHIPLMFKL